MRKLEIGSTRVVEHKVIEEDFANFEDEAIHEVYSTFAAARDGEWACRQFVREMKEEGEEGIGTFVNIEHIGPAFEGQIVQVSARLESIDKNEVICSFESRAGKRIIARGRTGQKVILKQKLANYFESLKQEN